MGEMLFSPFRGFRAKEEFEEEIKAYAEEIEGIRKRKDFELQKLLVGFKRLLVL